MNALQAMEQAFRRLETQVPAAEKQAWKDGFVFRFREKSLHQAILQKLARQISGLHAVDVLLLSGLSQERCVIQRTLDEIGEDIFFLALAATKGELSPLHESYLRGFWAEEFDRADPLRSTQKRGMTSRDKIRAYNARAAGLKDTSTPNHVGRTIWRPGFGGFGA